MSKLINWIYGLVLIYLALDALFIHAFPQEFRPIAVIIMGALILFTKLGASGPLTRESIGRKTIRFVFGAALVLMGLVTLFPVGYNNFPNFTVDTFTGQLIIAAIGAIYILASSRRGQMEIVAAG